MSTDTRTQINIVLNAIMDTLAEGHAIPASYPGLAAEQAGITPTLGQIAIDLAVQCGLCLRTNDLLTAGPRLAEIVAAKRAAQGPGRHPACKPCRYYGACSDDECADLDDARHPGRAQMRSAIDDADNNRAGW